MPRRSLRTRFAGTYVLASAGRVVSGFGMNSEFRTAGHTAVAAMDGAPKLACAATRPATVPFWTVSLATELGVLLALSLLFPFMIHLIPVPEDTRLGPRLLPMFYAPLLAALIGRPQTGLIVAVAAPWLNWLLTGHPRPIVGLLMTLQLASFVVFVRLLLRRLGPRWFLAAPAYVAALALSAVVAALFPAMISGRSAAGWFVQTLAMGLPGVGVMLLLNWFVVRSYPTGSGDGGNGPLAA